MLYGQFSQTVIAAQHEKDGEGNREEVVLIIQARCQTILMERKKIGKQEETWVDGKIVPMASFGGVG